MKKHSICYFRGFLGNQIIQSALGFALSTQKGNSVDFIYSTHKANSKLENANTVFSKEYLSILFKLNQKVHKDHKAIKKTPYWWHGAAKVLYEEQEAIKEKFVLKKEADLSHRSYVHIRATDKQSDNNYDLYANLIREALKSNELIYLVGDNNILMKELSSQSEKVIYEEDGGDEIDDWYKLLGASQIYCSPSTFAISTLFFGYANINVINPSDFTNYPHYLKEYIFIYELSKYFGRIKVLNPLKSPSIDNARINNPIYSFINKLPSSHQIQNDMAGKRINEVYNTKSKLSINDNNLETLLLDNSTIMSDTEDYLNKFLQLFDLNNSYIKNIEEEIKFITNSSNKSLKDMFIPPILEEYGWSIRRHYLKNMSYILNPLTKSDDDVNCFASRVRYLMLKHGFTCIENFVPIEKKKLVQEYFAKRDCYSLSKNQKTLLCNSENKYLKSIFFSKEFISLVSALTNYEEKTIHKELLLNTFFQEVRLKSGAKIDDRQQNFHIDTFYPAFKFWYFPYDVTIEDAPFEYVKYSHLPSKELYMHYQQNYVDNVYGKNYAISEDNREGSLRITPEEIRRLGYKPMKVTVKANTLVVANVGGLHRRSRHRHDVRRLSIHSSIRPAFGIKK